MDDSSVSFFQYSASELSVSKPEIYQALGYGKSKVPDETIQAIDNLLPAALKKMEIRCGFRYFGPNVFRYNKTGFYINDIHFSCGSIIARHFNNVTEAIFFAATLGAKFVLWMGDFFSKGDPYSGFLADAIGSVCVETVADKMMAATAGKLAASGLSMTNRFSPGYCQWNVTEQHKLFALLPEKFLGIHLTESALMMPIKSVSGMAGIGTDVRKLDYTCRICSQKNCIMRKAEEEER